MFLFPPSSSIDGTPDCMLLWFHWDNSLSILRSKQFRISLCKRIVTFGKWNAMTGSSVGNLNSNVWLKTEEQSFDAFMRDRQRVVFIFPPNTEGSGRRNKDVWVPKNWIAKSLNFLKVLFHRVRKSLSAQLQKFLERVRKDGWENVKHPFQCRPKRLLSVWQFGKLESYQFCT